MRNSADKICRENQDTYFTYSNVISEIVPFMMMMIMMMIMIIIITMMIMMMMMMMVMVMVMMIIIIIIIIITAIGLSPGGSGYFTCTQI
jgi:uncharacterized membrane protein